MIDDARSGSKSSGKKSNFSSSFLGADHNTNNTNKKQSFHSLRSSYTASHLDEKIGFVTAENMSEPKKGEGDDEEPTQEDPDSFDDAESPQPKREKLKKKVNPHAKCTREAWLVKRKKNAKLRIEEKEWNNDFMVRSASAMQAHGRKMEEKRTRYKDEANDEFAVDCTFHPDVKRLREKGKMDKFKMPQHVNDEVMQTWLKRFVIQRNIYLKTKEEKMVRKRAQREEDEVYTFKPEINTNYRPRKNSSPRPNSLVRKTVAPQGLSRNNNNIAMAREAGVQMNGFKLVCNRAQIAQAVTTVQLSDEFNDVWYHVARYIPPRAGRGFKNDVNPGSRQSRIAPSKQRTSLQYDMEEPIHTGTEEPTYQEIKTGLLQEFSLRDDMGEDDIAEKDVKDKLDVKDAPMPRPSQMSINPARGFQKTRTNRA